MAHFRRYRRPVLPAKRGLGDIASTIGAALDVASDPYLAEVVCHIQQLKQIDTGQPVAICAPTPDGIPGGVGLRKMAPALRAYVYAEQNPWVYPLVVAAVVGIPMWIGFQLAKGGS